MSSKIKTAFFCNNCGTQSPKWAGKCNSCGQWNTFTEEVIKRESNSSNRSIVAAKSNKATLIEDISIEDEIRLSTNDNELDRVLGGGLVKGSIVLLGGEPGIGKSTLLLQIALRMGSKILYASGEESLQQLKMRAERLGSAVNNSFILAETDLREILSQAQELKPDLLIVDSIQTLYSDNIDSSAGSISQIKECAAQLQKFAKESAISVFVIGHITKDGSLAGPKLLEHIVDTVLQFEGDRNYGYRIIRSAKNRFGSTNELGIYEMQATGLREVSNPSEILIQRRTEDLSGTTIAASIEGLRPLLIEVQALVGQSAYSVAQRSSTGFELKRLNMLLAVLEKRCGFRMAQKDVFLNIAGGLRVDDPAIDLAVVTSILSSYQDISISSKDCFAGEVGLTGEIRSVSRIEQRIDEAAKLGFKRIFISSQGITNLSKTNYKIKIVAVSSLFDLFKNVAPK